MSSLLAPLQQYIAEAGPNTMPMQHNGVAMLTIVLKTTHGRPTPTQLYGDIP